MHTVDCRPGGKTQTEGKMQTADCRPGGNVPVKSNLQHPPPPGIPRSFDTFSCPEGREFDHHS